MRALLIVILSLVALMPNLANAAPPAGANAAPQGMMNVPNTNSSPSMSTTTTTTTNEPAPEAAPAPKAQESHSEKGADYRKTRHSHRHAYSMNGPSNRRPCTYQMSNC